MCYYHQYACLLVCLSLLPACLSVKLQWMIQITREMQGNGGGGGRLSLQHNLKKRGFYRTSIFRGGCLKRGGDFFQGGGSNCHIIN